MAAEGGKPMIPGGRSLAKARRGKSGGGGSGGNKKKRPSWNQAGNDKREGKGKLGSWPVGEMPEDIKKRLGIL